MNALYRTYRAHSHVVWVGLVCAVVAGCARRPPETALVRGSGVDPTVVEDGVVVPTEVLHGAAAQDESVTPGAAEMHEEASEVFGFL